MTSAIATLCDHFATRELTPDEEAYLIAHEVMILSSSDADTLIECLKQKADQFRLSGKTEAAYQLGLVITKIGDQRGWFTYQALGHMVRGDARIRDLQLGEGWTLLEQASLLFLQAKQGNEPDAEFNWARTVIGKHLCAVDNAQTEQLSAESQRAEAIFRASHHSTAATRLRALYNNRAIFASKKGDYLQALSTYMDLLQMVESDSKHDQGFLAQVLTNVADSSVNLGRPMTALPLLDRAMPMFQTVKHWTGEHAAQQIKALALLQLGNYRGAFALLDTILNDPNVTPIMALYVRRTKVSGYLDIHDFESAERESEALLSAKPLSAEFQARTLDFLAIAQAEQQQLDKARVSIEKAIELAREHLLPMLEMTSRLHLAQIALHQADYERSKQEATQSLAFYVEKDHHYQADAHIVLAQTAMRFAHDTAAVEDHCNAVLRIAKHAPSRLYSVYVLLGHSAVSQGRSSAAKRYFFRALQIVDSLQRDLTIAYRPIFLSGKGEAIRALVALFLGEQQFDIAFDILERSRMQTFMGYLARQGAHRWSDDARSKQLIAELNRIRIELSALMNAESPQFDLAETQQMQRRVREITRELYTLSRLQTGIPSLTPIRLKHIRDSLPSGAILINYYDDGDQIHAIVVRCEGPVEHYRCADSDKVRKLLGELKREITFALRNMQFIPAPTACDASSILEHPLLNHPVQTKTFQKVVKQLFEALMGGFEETIPKNAPLFIIPHHQLHRVPFHLLFDGEHYLSDHHEITILPAAGLLAQTASPPSPGALILYDDLAGKLQCSKHDAEAIQQEISGECEAMTDWDLRELLASRSGKYLHLIAHAHFSENLPETSFIQVGKQQVFASDVLQERLQFELVVLTACETGRLGLNEHQTHTAHGDDVLGVGRAFLYAGAQAILASQWLLGDGLTLPLLQLFYQKHREGGSYANALHLAQKALRHQYPTLHPAFWGAFQLIGYAESGSTID
jgi:CHAT domain-containing protein